jgi:hypothetical protein
METKQITITIDKDLFARFETICEKQEVTLEWSILSQIELFVTSLEKYEEIDKEPLPSLARRIMGNACAMMQTAKKEAAMRKATARKNHLSVVK